MPLCYLPTTYAIKEVQNLATSVQNPKGRPWVARASPSMDRKSYKLRAYDPKPRNDHQCWVSFSIQDQGEASAIEATICNQTHHSAKVKKHVLEMLRLRYGRPIESTTEVVPA